MQRRHPGTVDSDRQAFEQIAQRVRQEVGGILSRCPPGEMPFWTLIRALFPVAESVGDLIHRKPSTVINMRLVLANEFESVRSGYRGIAATLATLYRHSLTHHDELRVVHARGRDVGWHSSGADDSNHLKLHRGPGGTTFNIELQPRAFYADVVTRVRGGRARALARAGHETLQRLDVH